MEPKWHNKDRAGNEKLRQLFKVSNSSCKLDVSTVRIGSCRACCLGYKEPVPHPRPFLLGLKVKSLKNVHPPPPPFIKQEKTHRCFTHQSPIASPLGAHLEKHPQLTYQCTILIDLRFTLLLGMATLGSICSIDSSYILPYQVLNLSKGCQGQMVSISSHLEWPAHSFCDVTKNFLLYLLVRYEIKCKV